MYPLFLHYITKSPIWGGTRLSDRYGKHGESETVGESWELAVRPFDCSRILNGPLGGRTLLEVLQEQTAQIMGNTDMTYGFPLLVKLIDADADLSVQVHPDDAYATATGQDRGKTEMWYIIEAEADSEIVYGLCEGVTRAQFVRAVQEGRLMPLLHRVPARAGDVFFIPSGLVHAIGKGILLAEIQQNSDLTYRIYDYDRTDAQGYKRALHVCEAIDVVRPMTEEQIEACRFEGHGGGNSDVLCDCAYFSVERMQVDGVLERLPRPYVRHMLVLTGKGTVTCDGVTYALESGDSVLLPASLPTLTLGGHFTALWTEGK